MWLRFRVTTFLGRKIDHNIVLKARSVYMGINNKTENKNKYNKKS
jgi:hypothetical protein